MCVIAYIPKGENITDDTIKAMFANNPDGAGLMWRDPVGVVEIRKGFFDVNSLIKAWHRIPKNCERAIHCRIATHGLVDAARCHPFPLRASLEATTYKVDHADMAIMHNGIIRFTSPVGADEYSDSQYFAVGALYPIMHGLDSTYVQEMVERSIDGSRLLIFRSNSDTIMLGRWVRDGKIYYSNNSYVPKRTYHCCMPVPLTPEEEAEFALLDDETRFLDQQ